MVGQRMGDKRTLLNGGEERRGRDRHGDGRRIVGSSERSGRFGTGGRRTDMKMILKKAGLALLRLVCGINLVDQRTGKVIARVAVIRWKGRLRLIGLEGAALRPHFLPQEKLTYWAQDLGFSTHAPPDFPHAENNYRADLASNARRGGGDDVGVETAEP